MAAKIDVMNIALAHLGKPAITAPIENSVAGRELQARWDTNRDAVLRDHPWNSCIRFKSVKANSKKPIYGYERVFPRSTDPFDLRFVDASVPVGTAMQVIGREIYSDADDPLAYRFVARIDDVGQYDAELVEAMGLRLAWATCNKLTQDKTLKRSLSQEYRDLLKSAKSVDGLEGEPPKIVGDYWAEDR